MNTDEPLKDGTVLVQRQTHRGTAADNSVMILHRFLFNLNEKLLIVNSAISGGAVVFSARDTVELHSNRDMKCDALFGLEQQNCERYP
jgi:hypothetical protein